MVQLFTQKHEISRNKLGDPSSEEGRREVISYSESVVSTNDPYTKYVFIIIKKLQSLRAGGGRETRLHINFPQAPNFKISLYNATAHKRFVLLWLVKPSDQRPNLAERKSISYHESTYIKL